MRVCYLDCYEARLCCYLVIYKENLLTFITAVLLPFVTYLLTLPRILHFYISLYVYNKHYFESAAINKLKDFPLYKFHAILLT
jgi:hypothetical protein